jgi:uncharacterized membrane protein YhiD involved in acid resistance
VWRDRVERDIRDQSAASRTHILLGPGAAQFTLASAYDGSAALTDDLLRT